MEKLKYEIPSIERKEDALDYIKEHYKYNSNINGSGGIQKYLDDYEGWLKKLEEDYNTIPNEEKVPKITYFLVRENDNKIVEVEQEVKAAENRLELANNEAKKANEKF